MLKSVPSIILAIALGVAAWLLPMRGEQATAQPGTLHVLVVELDIVPAEIDKFMTAIKELGAATVNEPGCRQFSIAISQKDANHVVLFEAWDNAAALDAYFATDRFKKYQVTTANMVAKRDIRVFSSVAMNFKATH
jgi:(4S)-4-hydroxy-5-phosphonooxypentane-2,3-dione isomerase